VDTVDDIRATRRGVLALAGGAVLAGCSLPLGGGSGLDGERLREAVNGDVPTVTSRFPVGVAEDRVQASAGRAERLIERARVPFDAATLPNGAIRRGMNQTAERARERLRVARDADSGAVTLATLRDARGAARTLATARAYIGEGRRRADLADDAAALAGDVASFRDRWSYVGDDPVPALVVHGAIEELVRAATAAPEESVDPADGQNLVAVSEYAADLERGRAALGDAAHLYNRIDASGAGDLGGAFRTALDDLGGELADAVARYGEDADPLSHIDADVAGTAAEHPLRLLYGDFTRRGAVSESRRRDEVASAVLAVHRELVRVRAFESLRDRAERDGPPVVESVDDVASIRGGAVEAIEAVMRNPEHPALAREALGPVPDLVGRNDDGIAAHGDEDRVPVERVRREVGEYLWADAVAQTVPSVNAVVAEPLTAV
jgi:hypothetical protein